MCVFGPLADRCCEGGDLWRPGEANPSKGRAMAMATDLVEQIGVFL